MIELIQNDNRPILRFTCRENGCGEIGDVINLAGCAVKFIFRKAFGTDTYKFKRPCDITDEANGVCEYSWQADDLDTIGNFLGEIEITFPDDKIQSNYNTINFKIKKELG